MESVKVIFGELAQIVLNTFIQSFTSTLLSLILGICGAIGINSVSSTRLRFLLIGLCFFTTFVPALFLIIGALNVIKPFPFGFWGVVILHIFSMVGFCSVIISQIFSAKIAPLERLSYIEGATRIHFLRSAIGSVNSELLSLFLYVFIVMFGSFSIPFMVAYDFPVFETYVFNILKTEANITKAFIASFLQIGIIFLLIRHSKKNMIFYSGEETREPIFLVNKSFVIIPLIPFLIILYGLFTGFYRGYTQLKQLEFSMALFSTLALKSIFLSVSMGFVFLIAFLLLAKMYYYKKIHNFFYRLVVPSTALIGLILWFVFGTQVSKDFQLLVGYFILFFFPLYRLKFYDSLQSLKKQIDVASIMGASPNLIFKDIIYPQILSTILFLSGVGAFWVIGDFALSHMVYGNDSTLALFIQSLAGQYRLEAASLLLLALFFCGAAVYTFFKSLKHVFN